MILRIVTFALALTSVSQAAVVTGTGLGGPMPNQGVLTSDILISSTDRVESLHLTLMDFSQSFAGNLIATLTHAGTSVDLFNRLGRTGGAGDGYDSNFNGNYEFDEHAPGDLWDAAAAGGASFDIPSGDYITSGADNVETLFDDLTGVSAAGIWRLSITVVNQSAGGGLGGWTLTLDTEDSSTVVPEPSSLVMAGMAALLMIRKFRFVAE